MPCDVVDFLSHSVLLKDDLAMLILTAAIKEPLPVRVLVEAWTQLPAHYSGSHLRSAILRAVAAADEAPLGAQLDQAELHRQGVGRFFGLTTTAKNLGVINVLEKQPKPLPRQRRANSQVEAGEGVAQQAAEPEPEALEYRLGIKNLTEYEVLDPSESKCDDFLEAARAEERCFKLATPRDAGAPTPGPSAALDVDLPVYGTQRVEAALQRMGAKSEAFQLLFSLQDAGGYDCIDLLMRKLVIARLLLQQNSLDESDWSTVDEASLQGMSADAEENLEEIPDARQASEIISSVFTGRTDWLSSPSMLRYLDLWRVVADERTTGEDDRAKALAKFNVKSKGSRRVVQGFRRAEDNIMVAHLGAFAYSKSSRISEAGDGNEQAKRLEARASTPRFGPGSMTLSMTKIRAKRTPERHGASTPRPGKQRRAKPHLV